MGLVAHWRLDGDATDSVDDYDGYPVNANYSSGKIGDSYDNTSDQNAGVELIRHDDFTEFENYYSFSLWFKSTTTSGPSAARILSRDASEYPTLVIDQSMSPAQNLAIGSGENPTQNVAVNEWHHIVITVDRGNTNENETYIDGSFDSSGGLGWSELARPYVIGGNTEGDGDISGGHFIGKIDDVRLYDHKLSAKEVKQLSRGKFAHYQFDNSQQHWYDNFKIPRTPSPQSNFGNNVYSVYEFQDRNANTNNGFIWNDGYIESDTSNDSMGLFYTDTSLPTTGAVMVSTKYLGTGDNDGAGLVFANQSLDEFWCGMITNDLGFNGIGESGGSGFNKRVTASDIDVTQPHDLRLVFDPSSTDELQFYIDGEFHTSYSENQFEPFYAGILSYGLDPGGQWEDFEIHWLGDRQNRVADNSGFGNALDTNNFATTTSRDSRIERSCSETLGGGWIHSHNSTLSATGDFTASFWAKPFNISRERQNPIHKDYADEYSFTMETDGDLSFYFNADNSNFNNYQTQNMFTTDDEWVHVVAVRDITNSEVRYYRNGSHHETLSLNDGNPISGTDSLQIGDGYTNNFNGLIDDVRLYATALNQSDAKELYEQRASIDAGGTVHAHGFNDGVQESFESGEFGDRWEVFNGNITTNRSYHGEYSFGSWNDGAINANIDFGTERKIDSFEYVWKEDGSQTGFAVSLFDDNTNVVQESGTENPQWQTNDGSGGSQTVWGSDGTNYNVWTRFRFDFDWDAGTYDYEMKKLDGSASTSGTVDLEKISGVREIRFHDTRIDGDTDTADYCRFDSIKINDMSVNTNGVFNGANLTEIGPATDSLRRWWPLDGNGREYSGNLTADGDSISNTGVVRVEGGLGQSSYEYDPNNDTESFSTHSEFTFTDGDPHSYSAWIKWTGPSSFSNNVSLFGDLGRVNNTIYLQDTNGDPQFRYRNADVDTVVTTNVAYLNGSWNHVAWTMESDGTLSVYENGSFVASTSVSNTSQIYNHFGAGYSGGSGYHLRGKLQDVRVYDRALSTEEVRQLYSMTNTNKKQRMIDSEDGTVITQTQFTEDL